MTPLSEPPSIACRSLSAKDWAPNSKPRFFATLSGENIHRIVAGCVPPNPISAALRERFGFKAVGSISENGYKFNRY
jgi:hypothetical protein